MKQSIKRLFYSEGRKLRRVRGGVGKGMLMELDLSHQSQYYLGLYEREIYRVLRRLIRSCKTLVDVGANDGYYTIAFLQSSAERVIGCEPGHVIAQLLAN